MTRTEAAAKYAEAYRAFQIVKGSTFNIEAATAYATMDVLNMVKTHSEADAVYVILDEVSYLQKALEKRAA